MRYFLFTILVCSLNILAAPPQSKVTFHVTVPEYTNSPVYLAGNVNNWDPKNHAHKLTKKDTVWIITIAQPLGKRMLFKFTRGDWKSVEKDKNGAEIDNREFVFDKKEQIVNLRVHHWADHFQVLAKHTMSGEIKIIPHFSMPQLKCQRRIWIYLPPDYGTGKRRYPVLYMHDGQNVFDAFTAFSGEWHVDETLEKFFADEQYSGAIVVAVDNGGSERLNEYSPWKHPRYGGGKGDLYCRFIVDVLKPYIDKKFRTLPDREFTGIAGSSMGGLISMYAIVKYGRVFSKAGVFSPAFWFAREQMLQLIRDTPPLNSKIYIDVGTREGNEDKIYVNYVQEVYDTLITQKIKPQNVRLLIDEGAYHNEKAWAKRFPPAFLWLFTKN